MAVADPEDVVAGAQGAGSTAGQGQHVRLGLQVLRPLTGQPMADEHHGHTDGQCTGGHGGKRQVGEHTPAQAHAPAAIAL